MKNLCQFSKPSIVKSFKSFQEQQGISIKDGKHHFSGVTISKQYKVVAGSKASITYMSKNNNHNKNQIKNIKEEKIQKVCICQDVKIVHFSMIQALNRFTFYAFINNYVINIDLLYFY